MRLFILCKFIFNRIRKHGITKLFMVYNTVPIILKYSVDVFNDAPLDRN